MLCDWHYSSKPEYQSVDRFRVAGFKQIPTVWNSLDAARRFVDYAKARGGDSVIGLMLTTWAGCDSAMDAIEAKRNEKGEPLVNADAWGSGEVYRAFARTTKPMLLGD